MLKNNFFKIRGGPLHTQVVNIIFLVTLVSYTCLILQEKPLPWPMCPLRVKPDLDAAELPSKSPTIHAHTC